MDEGTATRRATVHDVAREAGVSLATVDRVLNDRPGVRPQTAQRVEDAIRTLDFRRDLSASLLARARDIRIRFLIPDGSNEFMASLAAAIEGRARPALAQRLLVMTERLRALDATGLAARLIALDPSDCDCAIVVATESDEVLAAVDTVIRRGIVVMTLVSDLPGSRRRAFVGIDNLAAGRTAASLLGRFCPKGKIGVIAGSLGLRDHRQRLEGFRAVMETEFPQLVIVGPLEGHDQRDETEALTIKLLDENPDLMGLYNLGAGNAGLLAALDRTNRTAAIRVIAHELTPSTIAGLKSGAIDVVLDQNPEREIRSAIALARSLVFDPEGRAEAGLIRPIEIGIFLRDNLR
ncbi:MAG TPA: LacI family DNA-binding transcriptional regulator [Devosiaceae bacterium]